MIVRVMTYNILYGGVGREGLIADVVRDIHPDVAVFTEVTGADSFNSIADVVGPHRVSAGSPGAREFPVVVSRWPIVDSQWYGPAWDRRKWVEATLQPPGAPPLTIHGVHLVPQQLWPFELLRRWEVSVLLARLNARGSARQIVAGDFNALSAGEQQRREGAPLWVRAQWWLQGGGTPRWALRHLTNAGYVDCYRACNPHESGFTVPAWDPSARIDYVFASPSLRTALRAAGTCEVRAASDANPVRPHRSLAQLMGWQAIGSLGGLASDHLPVWADFDWSAL